MRREQKIKPIGQALYAGGVKLSAVRRRRLQRKLLTYNNNKPTNAANAHTHICFFNKRIIYNYNENAKWDNDRKRSLVGGKESEFQVARCLGCGAGDEIWHVQNSKLTMRDKLVWIYWQDKLRTLLLLVHIIHIKIIKEFQEKNYKLLKKMFYKIFPAFALEKIYIVSLTINRINFCSFNERTGMNWGLREPHGGSSRLLCIPMTWEHTHK